MPKNKPWNRPSHFWKRKENTRGQPTQTFLIVCEGEKTEPHYFEAFRVRSAAIIHINGTGKNTQSLVSHAIRLRDLASEKGEPYDQVWCVFDRDSFHPKQFNSAINQSLKENLKVAYSIEAFEIWYLLHFIYTDSGISREQYSEKLSSHLGEKYLKNSKNIYSQLLPRKNTAIRNAEKLFKKFSGQKYSTFNPLTTVHKLVIELDKYSKPE